MMRTLLAELEEVYAGDGVFRVAAQNLEGKFWPETTDLGQQVYRLELHFPAEGVFDFDALAQLLLSWFWLWGEVPDDLRDEMIAKLAIVTPGLEEIVQQRWKEYLAREAEIMQEIELRGDRMH